MGSAVYHTRDESLSFSAVYRTVKAGCWVWHMSVTGWSLRSEVYHKFGVWGLSYTISVTVWGLGSEVYHERTGLTEGVRLANVVNVPTLGPQVYHNRGVWGLRCTIRVGSQVYHMSGVYLRCI